MQKDTQTEVHGNIQPDFNHKRPAKAGLGFHDPDHTFIHGHSVVANDNVADEEPRKALGDFSLFAREEASKYDKFYTNSDVAAHCLNSAAPYIRGHILIEPSAGSGNLLDVAKSAGYECYAFDIAPEAHRPDIQKLDYLAGPIGDHLPDFRKALTLTTFMNPPFGKKGKLALKFLNKALAETTYVCAILPIFASEWNFQNQVTKGARLVLSELLPRDSFTFCVEPRPVDCVFQIWTMCDVGHDVRINAAPPTKHADFEMERHNCAGDPSILESDWEFAVRAQAYGDAAGVRVERGEYLDPKKQWMLFTPKTEAARVILNGLDYKGLSWGTTAVKGFGKARIFTAYTEALEAANDNSPSYSMDASDGRIKDGEAY